MKKFLFIATVIALIMGTTVNVDAKRRVRKKAATTTQQQQKKKDVPVYTPGSGNKAYTQEGVERQENGDVADLEMAFIQNLYYQYVIPGTIANPSYFNYVKPLFAESALTMLKDANGNIDWAPIIGTAGGGKGFTPAFKISKLSPSNYLVEDNGGKCYFEVKGSDGAYKITKVSTQPLN